jgi:hypothetical protein
MDKKPRYIIPNSQRGHRKPLDKTDPAVSMTFRLPGKIAAWCQCVGRAYIRQLITNQYVIDKK